MEVSRRSRALTCWLFRSTGVTYNGVLFGSIQGEDAANAFQFVTACRIEPSGSGGISKPEMSE